ncbi:MAG TPA: hypothetical protein VMM12_10680 [Longimicrobiales bacterium]|nr:hypothetical protein [Longimicrobiales bacterium]
MRLLRAVPLLLAGLVAGTACDDDGTGPDREDVAGLYQATTLVVTDGGADTDVLAEGAFITLGLTAAGATSGTLFVPGGNDDGSDLTADLTGTWTLRGDVVTLDHAADTFLRDLDFTYEDGRLLATTTELEVVLTRQ